VLSGTKSYTYNVGRKVHLVPFYLDPTGCIHLFVRSEDMKGAGTSILNEKGRNSLE